MRRSRSPPLDADSFSAEARSAAVRSCRPSELFETAVFGPGDDGPGTDVALDVHLFDTAQRISARSGCQRYARATPIVHEQYAAR
jgi:hypothetical protein